MISLICHSSAMSKYTSLSQNRVSAYILINVLAVDLFHLFVSVTISTVVINDFMSSLRKLCAFPVKIYIPGEDA